MNINGVLYKEKSSVSVFFSTEWLIASIFMLQVLNGYLSELLALWGIGTITTTVYLFIVGLCAIAYFKAMVNRPVPTLTTLFLVVGVLGISCFVNPEIVSHVFDFGSGSFSEIGNSELFGFLGLCLPAFLLCLLEVDLSVLYKWLYRYSVPAAWMFILLMGLHVFRFAAKLNYMSVAYSIMLSFMVLYYASREEHNRQATFLWIGILIGLLAGGCRGAVVTSFALVLLWELRKLFPLNAKKVAVLLIFIIGTGIILLNLRQILLAVDGVFAQFGYTSRLLAKYLGESADGDLLHVSDRMKIYSLVVSGFNFGGHGVFADRLVLNGAYAHNFICEILYQFGYFFGIPVLFLMICFLTKARRKARRSRDPFAHFICFSFTVYLCTKMMVSASYITDRMFWLYMGLGIAICKQKVRFNKSFQVNNRVPLKCEESKTC